MLKGKRARFVQEYLVDLNATAAARRAGYSQRTAKEQAHQLLQRPDISAAIAEAQADRSKRTMITADMVIAELAKIGFANMTDYMRVGPSGDPVLDFSSLTRDQAAALIDITVDDFTDARSGDAREVRRVRFKLADKRAALVDLGRHLGIFKDKIEIVSDEEQAEIAAEAHRRLEDGIARLAAVKEKKSEVS